MYKLPSNKECYISQTKRKYFKIALNYVLNETKKEYTNACMVNKVAFIFDFKNKIVAIKSNQDDRLQKIKMLEV